MIPNCAPDVNFRLTMMVPLQLLSLHASFSIVGSMICIIFCILQLHDERRIFEKIINQIFSYLVYCKYNTQGVNPTHSVHGNSD